MMEQPNNGYCFRGRFRGFMARYGDLVVLGPVMVLFILSYSAYSLVVDQYVYRYFLDKYNLNDTISNAVQCIANSSGKVQDEAQSKASYFTTWMKLATTIPALVAMPYLGSLSDRYGRNILFYTACIGLAIEYLALILTMLLNNYIWILLIGEVFHGFFGRSTSSLIVAVVAYISDRTEKQYRLFKVIFLDTFLLLASATGSMGFGYAINKIGFLYSCVVCLVGVLITMLYVFIFIPNTVPNDPLAINTEDGNKTKYFETFTKTWKLFFGTRTTRDGEDTKTKWLLLLLLLFVFTEDNAMYGDADIIYIYAQGYPLCWKSSLIGIYKAIDTSVSGVYSIVAAFAFRNVRSQELLAVIGVSTGMVRGIIIGLKSETYILFLGGVLGVPRTLVTTTMRAIASGLVLLTEQGSVLSGIVSVQIVADLTGHVTFSSIYAATINYYSRMVFFCVAILYAVSIPIIGCFWWMKRKWNPETRFVILETPVEDVQNENRKCKN